MRLFGVLFALLFAVPAFGQSTWPASKVVFADTTTLEATRNELKFYTESTLPTCGSPTWGLTFYISNATDATDCAAGTPGSITSTCFCDDDSTIKAIPAGAGGGGEANVTDDVGAGAVSIRGSTPKTGVALNLRTLSGVDFTVATDVISVSGSVHRDSETKDGDLVSFDDAGSKFAATNVDSAIEEFDDTNGAGLPNQTDYKVNWDQIGNMPTVFSDENDNGGVHPVALATDVSGILPPINGGTGATALTNGGMLFGSGVSPITALAVATNGQIPIGDGVDDPVLATISGTANETEITNGQGSITVGIVTSPTLNGTNFSGIPASAVGVGFLPLAGGGPITGDVTFNDTIDLIFGTTGDHSIRSDGTNLLINPTLQSASAYTDFTGKILVSADEDVYSQFGGAPTALTVFDSTDILVVRKQATTPTGSKRAMTSVLDLDYTGTSTQGYFGQSSFIYTLEGANTANSKLTGAGGATGGRYSFRHHSDGTFALAGGVAANAILGGAFQEGTITRAYAFVDEGGNGGVGVAPGAGIGEYSGLLIRDANAGTNVDTKYGVWIETLTNSVASSYGVRIDAVDTRGIWFNSDSGTAANGIAWGTTEDTNLYRSAADTLKTDDSFVAGGTLLGLVNVIVDATTADTVTAAEMNGSFFHYTNTGAVTITLPIPVSGMSGCFYDNSATGILTINPVDGVDTITLDGTTQAAGVDIDSAGAKGDFICLIATGVDTWLTLERSGTWITGT